VGTCACLTLRIPLSTTPARCRQVDHHARRVNDGKPACATPARLIRAGNVDFLSIALLELSTQLIAATKLVPGLVNRLSLAD